jgi:hypothetical protein
MNSASGNKLCRMSSHRFENRRSSLFSMTMSLGEEDLKAAIQPGNGW